MGAKTVALYGFGGFFLVGLVMMPFIPEPTPEEDLQFGKNYLKSTCEDVARHQWADFKKGRIINNFKYCNCLMSGLEGKVKTGDEYRFIARFHEAAGSERWFFKKSRAARAMKAAYKEFGDRLPQSRMRQLKNMMFPQSISCARSN